MDADQLVALINYFHTQLSHVFAVLGTSWSTNLVENVLTSMSISQVKENAFHGVELISKLIL
jgi:hypothetical protein